VKCAVRWLRANAKKYKIDPNRIGAIGVSSGGHLALMLGLTDSSDGLEGECGNLKYSSRVQAVANVSGGTELISWYNATKNASFLYLLGGTPEEVPEQYKSASPLTYVSKDDPLVFCIYVEGDGSHPLKQAKLLNDKMKAVGASHTLLLKKSKIGFWDDALWEFFDEHLKGK
jgi:acetyl esterase/lipase